MKKAHRISPVSFVFRVPPFPYLRHLHGARHECIAVSPAHPTIFVLMLAQLVQTYHCIEQGALPSFIGAVPAV